MLVRDGIPLDTSCVGAVAGDHADALRLTLRIRNNAARGLGLPLPAGGVAVFDAGARPLLIGEAVSAIVRSTRTWRSCSARVRRLPHG